MRVYRIKETLENINLLFWPWELARLQTQQEPPDGYPRWRIVYWKIVAWISFIGWDLVFLLVLLMVALLAIYVAIHR